MSVAWRRQRERGSRIACHIMVWIARRMGRPVARAILYPVCAYYLLFSGRARRAIRTFLNVVLQRSVTWRDLFHHYYWFASTILDRVYVSQDSFDQLDVTLHGHDGLMRCLDQGKGCVLVGAHLGSFDVVRAVGRSMAGHEIRILMYEDNAPMIRDLMRELNPELVDTIIQARQPDTMLRVKECLDRGGVVGIMMDRMVAGERGVACSFLGKPAWFPTGTIRLASVLQVPVVLFFGLYRGGRQYDVHFELFAERIAPARDSRGEETLIWMQRYAERLEYYVRLAPDNWFNFYDFWIQAR